ncbi:MAG: S9 family peptidase [Acidobacteriota bacterium]|nr:S9 family peptidase [Acidobacteriota bacterium]
MRYRVSAAVLVLAAVAAAPVLAQDRLKSYPGYERYASLSKEIPGAITSGTLQVTWTDARTFEYDWEGKRHRYDAAARAPTVVGDAGTGAAGRAGQGGPERGRQFDFAESPNGTLKAFYRDRNLWMTDAAGGNERQLTTDGSEKDRIKYGAASWVYGEELGQVTAMWWSPDSTKLAYYRFDEKQVPDYYLQLDQTKLQSTIDTEAYPKAGAPNPIVELFVYDVATGKSTQVDVRDGKPFNNDSIGHYVYGIRWAPKGRELLFNRTNRRQQIMELVAADPSTGEARVVVREEWLTGWADNSPEMRVLADGDRFIWESDRNGWNNFYLYDMSGKLIAPLTQHAAFEAANLIKVDEAAGVIFYTARDGDNPLKLQLHRVGLDGRNDVRLTDPAFHHLVGTCMPTAPGRAAPNCGISPDNKYFVDVYQTHDTPPATRLVDAKTGKVISEIVKSDTSKFDALGLKKAELFTYKATDGVTTLYGLLQFPSNFDPSKTYPVLMPVYGGPESTNTRETFVTPTPLTEYGFLVVNVESRAAPGRGKRQLDSLYLKLGQTEIDDLAAGVRSLWPRPYFDKDRVGVHGTSYGGYSSIMLLLEHPDAFAAAVASSPVTSWAHYDTIYTERYMWMPQENAEGYEAGSAMPRAMNLDGRLMLYWGTADNNVHPSNMMQLIAALQAAGKSFDLQVGPDRGHTGINQDRMMEYFIENLVMRPRS